MNAKEILIEKLKELGADGLCDDHCVCTIEDLCPFDCSIENCVPARQVECPACGVRSFVALEELNTKRFNGCVEVKSKDGKSKGFLCKIDETKQGYGDE